jgi:formylglycine-generating enzyme required for sulfatase activity
VAFIQEMMRRGTSFDQAQRSFRELHQGAQSMYNQAASEVNSINSSIEDNNSRVAVVKLKVVQIQGLMEEFDKQFPTTQDLENQNLVSRVPSAPKAAGATEDTRPNILDAKFMLIPSGTFQMGGADPNQKHELPVHTVTISKAFHLCTTEVTEQQWIKVMGKALRNSRGSNYPVIGVSWNNAQKFITELNKLEPGKGYRLPTEAEWEYACRAGNGGRLYGFPDAIAIWNTDGPSSVGQKQPNAWGLYDMIGNAAEWCQDFFESDYYLHSPSMDPKGPSSGHSRVLRGGCWTNNELGLGAGERSSYPPDNFDYLAPDYNGFRLAMTPR